MARSVRIDSHTALTALSWIPEESPHPRDIAARKDLRSAIEPAPTKARPKRKPPLKHSPVLGAVLAQTTKTLKRERRTAETADLWKQAMARSGGFCECKCGRGFHEEGENKPEMDHEASRRVPQTITNVWMLTLACHRERQRNRPTERYWLNKFLWHCQRNAYWTEAKRVEARIAVVDVKSALPAAPRLTNG